MHDVLAHADVSVERVEIDVEEQVLQALDQIEHIVILMMENRSFDHMLGYLHLSGRRPELDGLEPAMENTYRDTSGRFPMYDGQSFPVHELPDTKMKKSQDPPHGGDEVDGQLDGADGDNKGFVQVYMDKRGGGGAPEVHPNDVMGYHTERHLPVYDHLSEKFCVCDRWFSSVPGATFPNRLYSVAGRAAGKRDNINPPIYKLLSFVRHLDASKISWGWFVHDAAPILWAVDNDYPFHHLMDERVAWFDGHWRPPHLAHTFVQRAAAGKLPSVSWIDPSFADFRHGVFRLFAPPSNDDHPPSDVLAGQTLVLKVYDALASSPNWEKTLLLITYDEHGGFFDHAPPPKNPPDDDPKTFTRYGARVPALVVSPFVGRRSFSHELFDHASIIKTILLRFCRDGGSIPNMGKRVSEAQNLGVLLTGEPRAAELAETYRPLADKIEAGRKETLHDQLVFGATTRAATPTTPTDWQDDFLKIREGFMRQLIKEDPEKLIEQVPKGPVEPL
jgi:phospholipase C